MKTIYVLIALGCLMFSCATIRISGVETAENVNLHAYKTYNFYAVTAKGDTIPAIFNERLTLVKTAIKNELDAKGFTQTTSNSDILINIGVQIKKQVVTRDTQYGLDGPYYMGQRNYEWKTKTIEIGSYRNGSITVHLVDAKQLRLLWKGTTEALVPNNDKQLVTDIAKGMKKLFEQMPLEPSL